MAVRDGLYEGRKNRRVRFRRKRADLTLCERRRLHTRELGAREGSRGTEPGLHRKAPEFPEEE